MTKKRRQHTTSEKKENIRRAVQNILENKCISQKELANLAGVLQPTVSNALKGRFCFLTGEIKKLFIYSKNKQPKEAPTLVHEACNSYVSAGGRAQTLLALIAVLRRERKDMREDLMGQQEQDEL